MVKQRIKELRKRIQRRESAKRAKRRAKARRIEKEQPKGAAETAKVKAKQTSKQVSETNEEARALASDAKQLVATELGLSESESESFIKEAAGLIDSAGESLGDLDLDGDGDTDLMGSFEQSLSDTEQGGDEGVVDPTEPVMDLGGQTEPVMSDLDVEDPVEDEIFK